MSRNFAATIDELVDENRRGRFSENHDEVDQYSYSFGDGLKVNEMMADQMLKQKVGSNLGKRRFTDNDLAFVRSFKEAVEHSKFVLFFKRLYLNADEENKRHLNEIFPEYVDSIVNNLNLQSKLYNKSKMLNILPPASMEDCVFLYLQERGYKPPGDMWWLPDKEGTELHYARGDPEYPVDRHHSYNVETGMTEMADVYDEHLKTILALDAV